jgi:predicted CopG family antitoxin
LKENKMNNSDISVQAVITDTNILVVFSDGEGYTIGCDDERYDKLEEMVATNAAPDEIRTFIKIGKTIENRVMAGGMVEVDNGTFIFNGYIIPEKLAMLLDTVYVSESSVTQISNFIENMAQNPRQEIYNELFDFLSDNDMPLTEDGCFLAYKRVRDDFKDFYTGKKDYSVGSVVRETASNVDTNRHNTCSTGLHFCSRDYLPHYHSNRGKIIVVKVNPRDVAAIPKDYSNAKGRCSMLEVISVLEDDEVKVTGDNFNSKNALSEIYDNYLSVAEMSERYEIFKSLRKKIIPYMIVDADCGTKQCAAHKYESLVFDMYSDCELGISMYRTSELEIYACVSLGIDPELNVEMRAIEYQMHNNIMEMMHKTVEAYELAEAATDTLNKGGNDDEFVTRINELNKFTNDKIRIINGMMNEINKITDTFIKADKRREFVRSSILIDGAKSFIDVAFECLDLTNNGSDIDIATKMLYNIKIYADIAENIRYTASEYIIQIKTLDDVNGYIDANVRYNMLAHRAREAENMLGKAINLFSTIMCCSHNCISVTKDMRELRTIRVEIEKVVEGYESVFEFLDKIIEKNENVSDFLDEMVKKNGNVLDFLDEVAAKNENVFEAVDDNSGGLDESIINDFKSVVDEVVDEDAENFKRLADIMQNYAVSAVEAEGMALHEFINAFAKKHDLGDDITDISDLVRRYLNKEVSDK